MDRLKFTMDSSVTVSMDIHEIQQVNAQKITSLPVACINTGTLRPTHASATQVMYGSLANASQLTAVTCIHTGMGTNVYASLAMNSVLLSNNVSSNHPIQFVQFLESEKMFAEIGKINMVIVMY